MQPRLVWSPRHRASLLAAAALALAAAGCVGGGAEPAGADGSAAGPIAAMGTPTWSRDVAPIVVGRCAGCHRDGGIAPFSLETYADARLQAPRLVAAVTAGIMPPFSAAETKDCKPRFSWKDDPRLSAAQQAILGAWARAGAPEGDPADVAPLPKAPTLELAGRNLRTTAAKPYVVAGKKDAYRCFPLPYTFDADTYVTGVQVVPGNPKVVHHVLVWIDEAQEGDKLAGADGSYECFGAPGLKNPTLLSVWAPGAVPVETPKDVGIKVKKGAKLVINVHYHPQAAAETDPGTSVDLRWVAERPIYEGRIVLVGNAKSQDATGDGLQPGPNDPVGGPAFVIPANARDHVESQVFTVPQSLEFALLGARVWAVGTHMHYVGTDMRIELDRTARTGGVGTEPAKECLLETPRWDFNWQRGYAYDAPLDALPTVRSGDKLKLRCVYDNSMANPFVQDALAQQGLAAPREVRLGEMTLDEMCLGVFGLAFRTR